MSDKILKQIILIFRVQTQKFITSFCDVFECTDSENIVSELKNYKEILRKTNKSIY